MKKLLLLTTIFYFSPNWALESSWQDITKEFQTFPNIKVLKHATPEEYIVEIHNLKPRSFFDKLIGQMVVKSPSKGHLTQEIEFLHIKPTYRGSKMGSALLKYALAQSKTGTTLEARPQQFQPGETYESMLPKLLAFYEKHGGVETDTTDHIFYFKPS